MYNQPTFQTWKWTLGNLNGFIVLGCLGILLTFSQSRAWVVLRYLIHLRKKSIRLDGDTHSDPLEDLSQMHAIKDVVPFIKHLTSRLYITARRPFQGGLQRQVIQPQHDSPIISPLFGMTALLNAVLFVAMGVAIPCIISEGTLGAPLVKSRVNDACLWGDNLARPQDPHHTDAIFQLCDGYYSNKSSDCGQKLHLQPPKIMKSRLQICPFPGNICYSNNTDPIEFMHENITGYDIGINTKSRILMNHRLTCSPVHLDSFLLPNLGPHHLTKISVQNINFTADGFERGGFVTRYVLPFFDMTLHSLNGPNRFSNRYSGNPDIFQGSQKSSDLTILPNIPSDQISVHGRPIYRSIIHPDLRRDDGIPFLVIYRAEKRQFSFMTPVDDPLFAAHRKCQTIRNLYCPDYEATALGCVDQVQYCISGSAFCTSWGPGYEEAIVMKKKFENEKDIDSLADLRSFSVARDALSLQHYLMMRQKPYPVPINTVKASWEAGRGAKVAKDQWVAEVETWFMRAIIEAILEVQRGPRSSYAYNWESVLPVLDAEYSTCQRILFRNANYIVINWLEFWLIISLLVLICIASYTIKSLDKITRRLIRCVTNVINFLRKRLGLAARTMKSIIMDRRRRNPTWPFNRILRHWAWNSDPSQAPDTTNGLNRHESRRGIGRSDIDDSEIGSASVSLEELEMR